MGFFTEWKDSVFTQRMAWFFGWIMVIIMLGILIQSGENPALIYLIMGIVAGFAGWIEFGRQKTKLGDVFVYGTKERMFNAAIGGLILGGFLWLFPQTVISTPITTSISTNQLFNILFVVIAAPFLEEALFRNTLDPTFGDFLGNPILGMITANFMFAIFHFVAFSGNLLLITTAFIFGMIASIGNRYFKSGFFGVALHFVNNLRAAMILGLFAGLVI